MPDYGLIVRNNGNEIQIDGKYRNFSCFDSGSLSIGGWTNTVNFINVTEVPIIGIRPSPGMYCTWGGLSRDASGNYVSGEVYGEDGLTGTIQWIAFLEGIYNALPAYGLVVRNPSNEVCFSSNESYFKIKGVHSVISGTNVTVQDADNNYFLLYPFSWESDSVLLEGADPSLYGTTIEMLGIKKISSTIISPRWYITVEGTTDAEEFFDATHSGHILIEVGI